MSRRIPSRITLFCSVPGDGRDMGADLHTPGDLHQVLDCRPVAGIVGAESGRRMGVGRRAHDDADIPHRVGVFPVDAAIGVRASIVCVCGDRRGVVIAQNGSGEQPIRADEDLLVQACRSTRRRDSGVARCPFRQPGPVLSRVEETRLEPGRAQDIRRECARGFGSRRVLRRGVRGRAGVNTGKTDSPVPTVGISTPRKAAQLAGTRPG